jgi:hypothetical protein
MIKEIISNVSQLKCTSSQLGMKFSLTSPFLLATGFYYTPIPYHHITIITASLDRLQAPLSFTPGLALSTFTCTIRSVPSGSKGLLTTNPASPDSPLVLNHLGHSSTTSAPPALTFLDSSNNTCSDTPTPKSRISTTRAQTWRRAKAR